MSKLIGDDECYSKMRPAAYGFDAYGNAVDASVGYAIIPRDEKLEKGDCPFDVYSGWLGRNKFNPQYHYSAVSSGRWTTWQRPYDP